MLETKTLKVLPEKENYHIDLWSKFGWEVKSSQEIYSKDSHLEDKSDGLYSVTTTTHYIKLVFQRDKDMPNYETIKEIEDRYHAVLDPYDTAYNIPGYIFLGSLGIALISTFTMDGFSRYLGLTLFFFVIAIATGFILYKIYESNQTKKSIRQENYKKRQSILEELN